jgi:hypothetical protein
MITASGGMLSDINYYGFSPRVGASMSIPLFYKFLKLDVDADFEPIIDFGGAVVSTGHDSSNGATDWSRYYEKDHERSGIAFMAAPRATVYLRRLFFGLGTTISIAYNQGQTTKTYYDSQTGQELDRKNYTGNRIDFDQNSPSICIGIRHRRISIHYYQEGTSFAGIKLRFRIAQLGFAIADGNRNCCE